MMDRKFAQDVTAYFTHLRRLQAAGGATGGANAPPTAR